MVRRSWILLTGAVCMGGLALVSVTGCAQAQEDARAQEVEPADAEPMMTFAFGGGSYLGVYLSDVEADDVRELSLKAERGARVEKVADESPAAEAGIEPNDVIVAWNDTPIESVAQLTRMVKETPAGRTVTFGVMRDGRQRDIEIEIGTRSSRGFAYGVGPDMERARIAYDRALGRMEGLQDRMDANVLHAYVIGRPRLGVSLQNLTPQLGEYFGVEDGEGALVSSVREDSPAEKAGFQAGDVIVRIGDASIEGPGDVMRAISEHEEGELEVTVVRDQKRRTLKATLEKPEAPAWEGTAPRIYVSPGNTSVRLGVPGPRGTPAMPVRASSWDDLAPTAL